MKKCEFMESHVNNKFTSQLSMITFQRGASLEIFAVVTKINLNAGYTILGGMCILTFVIL